MARDTKVKICGLRRPEDIAAAVDAGATYVGFVFFQKSPRNISIESAAALAISVPPGVAKVGLVVDADDPDLDKITGGVPLDMIQLHGIEPPARVAEVKQRYGLPVMKAVGIADAEDLAALTEYGHVADQILVDAKPPRKSELPGGNGLSFDWRLVSGRRWPVPWMLAGGLTSENVAEAIRLTGAVQVDVSSGVEVERGRKDPNLIRRFIRSAQSA